MTPNSIKINTAKHNDLEGILTLFVETINTVCAKDYSPEQRAVWTAGAQYPERMEKKLETQYFLVARIAEKLVGFASLENNYLDFLFVHKDFQGLGIAKQLYDTLLQKANETNVKTLTSNVSLTARPFFEKMGFEVICKQDNLTRGVNLNNFKMEKRLEKETEIESLR
ncbi:GNAT family N-acetyltransferase [uncultured Draconibacterium sp.]|uniref:GNAT family N-acetyltransferase n=1 Tax=uncultured Draconibacterium sp. TaxID=1573823 RepID=UPI002AA68E48|nr:GNAT family N-acetyltransferase [uncultured Draconibacterium sp.]